MNDYLYFALQCVIVIGSAVIYSWLVRLRYTKRSISFFTFKWINMTVYAVDLYIIVGNPITVWSPFIMGLLFGYPMLYSLEVQKKIERYNQMKTAQDEVEEFRKKVKKDLVPWALMSGMFITIFVIFAVKGIFF